LASITIEEVIVSLNWRFSRTRSTSSLINLRAEIGFCALSFCEADNAGRPWYAEQTQAGMQSITQSSDSRSRDAVIHVYDDAGNVIETHEHEGDSKSGETCRGTSVICSTVSEKRHKNLDIFSRS
jgi:hypothetical protein